MIIFDNRNLISIVCTFQRLSFLKIPEFENLFRIFIFYLMYLNLYCLFQKLSTMSRPLLVHGCRLLNLTGVHDWHKPVLYTLGQIQGSCTIVPCTAFSTTDRGEYSTKPGKAYTSTIGKPVITIPVTGKSKTA